MISPTIYLPRALLERLTEKEYEAVLAHEAEHLRNKDLAVRWLLEIIGAIFWWIPTRWLRKRIEEGQEVGCDAQCKRYGVDPLDLASALCKSAKMASKSSEPIVAYRFAKPAVQRRIRFLLGWENIRFRTCRQIFSCALFVLAFFVIFLGRFWIF